MLWKWGWTNRMKLMHDETNNNNNTTLGAQDTRCGVAVTVPESGTWKSWSHSTSAQHTYVIYTAVKYHVLHFVEMCCSDIRRGTTQDNFYDKWSEELRSRGEHIGAVHVHYPELNSEQRQQKYLLSHLTLLWLQTRVTANQYPSQLNCVRCMIRSGWINFPAVLCMARKC